MSSPSGRCAAIVLSCIIALSSHSAPAGLVDTVTDTSIAAPTVDGTVNGGEYVGTVSGGGGGFGGPIGGATLSVDSDASNMYLGLSGLGDYSGNSIRIYFDTQSGGFSELSDAAGFNDFADFGRERLSRPASNGLTLPFDADFGLIISPAFGGFYALFQLATGGNNSLISQPSTGTAVGENPTNSTFEISIPYSSLGGVTPGDAIDFVVIYGNNNDQDSAFLSNEGFPFQDPGGNYGNGPATINDFHRLVTVPEASAFVFGGVACALIALRRRGRALIGGTAS